MAVKKSIIWQISDEEFTKLIKNSKTYKEALGYFGLSQKGGNYKTIKVRIKFLNLDTSHFLTCREVSANNRRITKDMFLKKLTKNSQQNNGTLKKRLIKFNFLEYKCSKCGNTGVYNEQPLLLQLDHINGVHDDNRIENLRILCPNCHSQTENYAGKKSKKRKCVKKERPNQRKVKRPTKDELKKIIWQKPTSLIAKEFGVSDKAIEKWCKSYGISKPPRGYWAKIKYVQPSNNQTRYLLKFSKNPYQPQEKGWCASINSNLLFLNPRSIAPQ